MATFSRPSVSPAATGSGAGADEFTRAVFFSSQFVALTTAIIGTLLVATVAVWVEPTTYRVVPYFVMAIVVADTVGFFWASRYVAQPLSMIQVAPTWVKILLWVTIVALVVGVGRSGQGSTITRALLIACTLGITVARSAIVQLVVRTRREHARGLIDPDDPEDDD